MQRTLLLVVGMGLMSTLAGVRAPGIPDPVLPAGVRAVWDLEKADRQKTATRERVCLNGLWRWQPAEEVAGAVPAERWGYFKVPGAWPGNTDYMQKDSQRVFPHPDWKSTPLPSLAAVWYQREITVPADWTGRRVTLYAEYLNSLAAVFVDGKRVGEIRYPAGELDLTAACRPGGKYLLSLHVVALPLRAVMMSHNDTNTPRQVRGRVARRGLCGDVFLVGAPAGPRITDVAVVTSVRQGELAVNATLEALAPAASYILRAEVREGNRRVREFTSPPFRAADLPEGRLTFREKWMPSKLWDLNTPGNMLQLQLTLREGRGKVLDVAAPERFGFRELWIEGRDLYLNGSRLFLSALPFDNAQVGAALANYAAAKESMERLKSFGINFVYTHNYGCEPGTHLSFEEILQAADDTGMLVSLTQPHFGQYDWQMPDADRANGYAQHAAFYTRVAGSHPSVVAYSTSHNTTGYSEDMNPDLLDGRRDPREGGAVEQARRALRAEAIIRSLDGSRIVYHHSSGNLGAMHTMNFYTNFVPVQELSDWYGHWAKEGVKPAFMVEYGVPFSWDWGMYRGWYQGQREFGSAVVPWEFCLAEWDAQFFGDRAYQISAREKANLRWEAEQFRAGKLWHRWDYPGQLGDNVFEERDPVFALYLTDNWRAFRTWGVSGISPWEHHMFWTLREGVDRGRKDLPVDWDRLQRPGLSADYTESRFERMDLAYERSDWLPTAGGQALLRNNMPLLAYIGGKNEQFTSKDHNFLPGETVEKQLILINNSRATVGGECDWTLLLPQPITGTQKVSVKTGEQERIPLRIELPASLTPGRYDLRATVRFSNGERQQDRFALQVLPRPTPSPVPGKVALFDPKGETTKLLQSLQVPFQSVAAGADLAPFETLIIGKGALTRDGAGPNVDRVRNGLKVVLFEQSAEVLEQRFGFRVAEYGLRWVFPRVPGHPLLNGLPGESLRDWRGAATLSSPQLQYSMRPRYGPTVKWCDIEVTRLWRCGSQGNVASVLIEKPARGDFLPIVDGGYSLQYSPLMEYREGQGMVLFCQMDVTGRSEGDPAAEQLTRNLLSYVASWKPAPRRESVYIGDAAGKSYLEAAGISARAEAEGGLTPDRVLIVGPGGGQQLAGKAAQVRDWLKAGGRVLAIGLDETDANAFLPAPIRTKKEEHIAAFFEAPGGSSPLAGAGPADVHNRDPRALPLVTSGATAIGDGVLAQSPDGRVVFCQMAPWQFDAKRSMNLKRTFRRSAFLVGRLLGNMGVSGSTPVLSRFRTPVEASRNEQRWLQGLYLDIPEEWDDPYRFFRW